MCQPHWDKLRAAIKSRGLYALVAESGERAIDNLVSELDHGPTIDNYDPLMSAHWAIINNLADIDPNILFMDGCPLCFGNKEHAKKCKVPGCTDDYDSWIDHAADDQVTEWKARGNG